MSETGREQRVRLYLQSDKVVILYRQPEIIWLTMQLMLLWISWMSLKAHRGEMNDDPMEFALKDVASWVAALLVVLALVTASIGVGVWSADSLASGALPSDRLMAGPIVVGSPAVEGLLSSSV